MTARKRSSKKAPHIFVAPADIPPKGIDPMKRIKALCEEMERKERVLSIYRETIHDLTDAILKLREELSNENSR